MLHEAARHAKALALRVQFRISYIISNQLQKSLEVPFHVILGHDDRFSIHCCFFTTCTIGSHCFSWHYRANYLPSCRLCYVSNRAVFFVVQSRWAEYRTGEAQIPIVRSLKNCQYYSLPSGSKDSHSSAFGPKDHTKWGFWPILKP